MRSHVALLGLLYIVAGSLSALAALSLAALGFGALTMVWSAGGDRRSMAAGVAAATFFVVALLLLIWGGANAWTGRAVRRHRPWSRMVAMVLGVLNLFVLPFGTALGAYALWVLLHNEVRPWFEPAGPRPARR